MTGEGWGAGSERNAWHWLVPPRTHTLPPTPPGRRPPLHRPSCSFGRVLHDPSIPPRQGLTAEQYADKAGTNTTTLNHFFEKLLHLKVGVPLCVHSLPSPPSIRCCGGHCRQRVRNCRRYCLLLCLLPACLPQDLMLTPSGRRLAEGRHTYVQGFLAQFDREWQATA